jgi:putative transposase
LEEFYMKQSKFTDSQIIDALKRVEAGYPIQELCRELGISSAEFYKWRAKYGGMDVSMMARMKELEIENARLKKMYAEERLKAVTCPDSSDHSFLENGLGFSGLSA